MNIYVTPHNDFAKFLIEISKKWQEEWIKNRVFEAEYVEGKPKFFLTAAFPYPNGPSHMGHSRVYTVTDVYARYKRMKGYNVLFPMAFHYTGTPVLAMAEALKRGDQRLLGLFLKVYGVPEDVVKELDEPLKMAKYFHAISKLSLIESGFSIDWRREFTTIDPEFKAFIRWQFEKLREKGYLVKGSHPVGWCPYHQMPVGMHDTKEDKEPEIGVWTLLHFKDDSGRIFPTATLRPETVFGVTNVWVNPEEDYVEAKVEGETWIVSLKSSEKLKYQKNIRVESKLKGSELLGLRVRNPVTGERVPILPARFVDPNVGTGVVMSVPAHAPYDYIAILDLKSEVLEQYKVKVEELKPRPLISVEGYSNLPARDVVERLKVKSQLEIEKLEEATREVYSEEFKKGVMKREIVEYVGLDLEPESREYVKGVVKTWIAEKPVREARENLVKWLKESGYASEMYEIMNRPVYCRCGNEVVVKILEDQWFIDYGNPEWKEKSRKALEKMNILPPEYRGDFKYTIEWVDRKACARTRGLGTELPWSKGWIIESLSDSTIYMAYYTISHKIRKYKLKPEQLTLEFWDYVMLGRGDVREVSEKTKIPVRVLRELKRDFEYWYPLDSRHSGKDLIPNHLTFFIYNHTAIFPEDKWPKQIAVNGWVLLRGHKMSKSLGNVIPLRIMNNLYGPDVVRASVILSAEVGQDADLTDELLESVLDRLRKIYENMLKLYEYTATSTSTPVEYSWKDKWMLSRLQRHIEDVTKSMEELKLRDAANTVFYLLERDLRRYLEMIEEEFKDDNRKAAISQTIAKVLEAWVKMLAPFTPHLAEELWHKMGREEFISKAEWPSVERELISEDVEARVDYIDSLIEDVREIVRVLGRTPKKAVVYVVNPIEYESFRMAIEYVDEGRPLKDYVKALIEKYGDPRRTSAKAKRYYEQATKTPLELRRFLKRNVLDEVEAIKSSIEYVKKTLNLEVVEVYRSDDPKAPDYGGKKKHALPLKPAIYLE